MALLGEVPGAFNYLIERPPFPHSFRFNYTVKIRSGEEGKLHQGHFLVACREPEHLGSCCVKKTLGEEDKDYFVGRISTGELFQGNTVKCFVCMDPRRIKEDGTKELASEIAEKFQQRLNVIEERVDTLESQMQEVCPFLASCCCCCTINAKCFFPSTIPPLNKNQDMIRSLLPPPPVSFPPVF